MLLGCIADDFTGATDLANTLVGQGIRTVQTIGLPGPGFAADGIDAVVVALKSRTIPAAEAIEQSLAALDWLRRAGCRQFMFKYCSTFDSTDAGNIGPVADALLDALGADFTIACPAFPTNARTIYKGYLFVGDVLLSESGMRNHPLTPMTDPSLVRVLQRQTPHGVGLVEHRTVARGADAIRAAFDALRAAGTRHAVVDALTDADLMAIGRALDGMPLLTGGSGVAMGLPENFRRAGLLKTAAQADAPQVGGFSAVLSGSCSDMTNRQVAAMRADRPAFALDPMAIAAGEDVAAAALAWAEPHLAAGPVLVYSTATPEAVQAVQAKLGREAAGGMVEAVMGRIAEGLVARGVRRLIVAGGETSGAVVTALKVPALRIGPEIDPGVPWTEGLGSPRLALALKSGNFGGPDFFAKALAMLPEARP
ncbi:MAG: 3-oxo-tetronate kinase [Alphaproteobacteria bacterium]